MKWNGPPGAPGGPAQIGFSGHLDQTVECLPGALVVVAHGLPVHRMRAGHGLLLPVGAVGSPTSFRPTIR